MSIEYFGDMVVERRPDLTEAAEMRTAELDPDVDGEDDTFVEIDDTLPHRRDEVSMKNGATRTRSPKRSTRSPR